jgi:excisionase family DNA binding protein
MSPDRRPVVVVLGEADQTLTASLRTVGLTPIAQEEEIVIWGPPPRRPDTATSPAQQPPTSGPGALLMTIADAALALGLGRSTVYELIGRGELEVVHVGRSARVPAAALQTLIERLRAGQSLRAAS